jgi:TATA-box binding protein (TBP) (component of TFIID and TFIIIB)
MILHPEMGKRVALVFDSGKICVSGAHSWDEIVHDLKVIWPMLVRCQYTVQNQKDDEVCNRILTLSQGDSESPLINAERERIAAQYENHKHEIQAKRAMSAQIRVQKMREKKQADL